MTAVLIFTALAGGAGPITISYDQFSGLCVDVADVRLIAGSGFQYYEPGWKGGIYSSRWQPKAVASTPNEITVRYQGKDRAVLGTIKYTLAGNDLTARYEFQWNGDREVRIENCFGLLWASAFKDARAESNELRRSRFFEVPMVDDTVMARALAVGTRSLAFDAPFGRLSLSSSVPFLVFDGRNYPQDWARGRPVHWAGVLEHAIKPGERVAYTVKVSFSKLLDRPASTETISGLAAKFERAQAPLDPLPVLPTPRSIEQLVGTIDTVGRFVIISEIDLPTEGAEAWLNSTVASRWEVAVGTPTPVYVRNPAKRTSFYSVWAKDGTVNVETDSAVGLMHAVTRIAQLVRSNGAGLVIPNFRIINDVPKVGWRGTHMLVGPQAPEFQTRLMDRLLVPLRLNNVVLQCERTAWESLPGIATASTMSRDDLAKLFDTYRSRGIEPIPLIQSLGHMEWMFANGQNLDIAINAAMPYTLDVRKQRAREVTEKIWTEAITLLQPKTVHFGLDEIDSRGFPSDPTLATRLWNIQVPNLMAIAAKFRVRPMLWGDMMLAQGEANDGMHAPDTATAVERRSAVPPDALIGDWHYANEPNPLRYKSIAKWNSLKMRPIATGWYRPNNIFGLTKAAIANKAGYLQATWLGYESSELKMVEDMRQLTAYLLAGEYSWGWQTLPPNKLPYDPAETARRMMYDTRQPARPTDGYSLLTNVGQEFTVGQFKFRGDSLFHLRSLVSTRSIAAPTGMVVSVNRAAKRVAAAVDCFAWMEVGVTVATITVHLADGTSVTKRLRYGVELRAADDPNATALARSKGRTAVVIEISDTPALVKSIEFQRADAAAGLRVHGITLI